MACTRNDFPLESQTNRSCEVDMVVLSLPRDVFLAQNRAAGVGRCHSMVMNTLESERTFRLRPARRSRGNPCRKSYQTYLDNCFIFQRLFSAVSIDRFPRSGIFIRRSVGSVYFIIGFCITRSKVNKSKQSNPSVPVVELEVKPVSFANRFHQVGH